MGCSSAKQERQCTPLQTINRKVKLRWLGHSGFRIEVPDIQDASINRCIYIDPWLDNPFLPEDLKGKVPNDADLVLITHGHFDHSSSAPGIIKASSKKEAKIICNYELFQFYQKHHGVKEEQGAPMNKGGQLDFGYCRVQMVSADHSSTCLLRDQTMTQGGEPCGFVVSAGGANIYHAGDTNVFGNMAIIDKLYKPTHLLLPIGGSFTMGPREAAYAVSRFLPSATVTIPMHFGTFPLLKGTTEEFEAHLRKFQPEFKRKPIKVIAPQKLMLLDSVLP
ncbi:beta-lactamase-like protein [Stylonychia lemnae]|uniref:Beta-lactamase-like protein n=1 Tax=Stylonychia lemnae TaxID=5949 RepID=A0A078BBH1_STYLE|nr:beta-lactamase-like protein [Stylonychia lemnae]|eukprot:CDW90903.1 beta-lactamase-like protein [Stylonychia lemnae]